MSKTKGTPKTLREAIKNAFDDPELDHAVVEAHVRDFLAQKFGAAYLGGLTFKELWEAICRD